LVEEHATKVESKAGSIGFREQREGVMGGQYVTAHLVVLGGDRGTNDDGTNLVDGRSRNRRNIGSETPPSRVSEHDLLRATHDGEGNTVGRHDGPGRSWCYPDEVALSAGRVWFNEVRAVHLIEIGDGGRTDSASDQIAVVLYGSEIITNMGAEIE
jgi:hypothetical protein